MKSATLAATLLSLLGAFAWQQQTGAVALVRMHGEPCAHGREAPTSPEGTRAVTCAGGEHYLVTAQPPCDEAAWCWLLPAQCYDVAAVGPPALDGGAKMR